MKKNTEKHLKRLIKVEEQLVKIKDMYAERDRLLALILSEKKREFSLDGYRIRIIDTFEFKNVNWKAISFSRYVVEMLPKALT